MQKLTLVVILLLSISSAQAQKIYNLEFAKGSLSIIATDSTEVLNLKPLASFNRSDRTFTFNSVNTVRQINYSRINRVSFDGDVFTFGDARILADSIDGYMVQYQSPTLLGDGSNGPDFSTPGLVVRQAPEVVKWGPVTTSVGYYPGDVGEVSLNTDGIVGIQFIASGAATILTFDGGAVIRLDTSVMPSFKIDPLWDPNCRCWAPIPNVDINPSAGPGNGCIVILYLAQD